MECPNCNQHSAENAKFCSGCGIKFEEILKCEDCEAELAPDTRFCSGCGKSIVQNLPKTHDSEAIKTQNAFYDSLSPILGLANQETEKPITLSVANSLRPILRDFAGAQVGEEFSVAYYHENSEVVNNLLHVKRSQLFNQILERNAEFELKEIFLNLLELGCVYHLMIWACPTRGQYLKKLTDESLMDIQKTWLEKSLSAGPRTMPWRDQAGKEAETIFKHQKKILMDSFYKRYKFGWYFGGPTKAALNVYTFNCFYSGAMLAGIFDIASMDRLHMV